MKGFYTLLVILFCCSILTAQVELSARVGIGFSNMTHSIDAFTLNQEEISFKEIYGSIPSLGANFTLYSNTNKPISLGLEPGFVTKGYSDNTGRLTFIYFHIPAVVRVNISSKFHLDPLLDVGTILIANAYSGQQRTDLKKFGLYNIIDYSVGLGIGYQLNEKIDIGARYSRSLTVVDEIFLTDINGVELYRNELKPQYFNLYLSYRFYKKEVLTN